MRVVTSRETREETACVFSFFRTRTGPAEFWDILVGKDAVPEAEKRFGRALMYRGVVTRRT